MGFSLSEQETVIQFSREDKHAAVWTSDSTMITKLDKLVDKSDLYHVIETNTMDGKVCDKKYRIDDKTRISFRQSKTKLTDEEKRRRAEILRNAMNENP